MKNKHGFLIIVFIIVITLILRFCCMDESRAQSVGSLNPLIEKESFYSRIPRPVKVITFCLITTTIDAVSDAWIAQNKNVVLAHTIDAANWGLLLSSRWLLDLDKNDWLPFLSVNMFFRASIYDYIYCNTRGLPWNYRSEVSLWDKVLTEVNPPPSGEIFFRSLSFSFGVSITIIELK